VRTLDEIRESVEEMLINKDHLPDYCYISGDDLVVVLAHLDKAEARVATRPVLGYIDEINKLSIELEESKNIINDLQKVVGLLSSQLYTATHTLDYLADHRISEALPRHISFSLYHNPHVGYYDTVAEHLNRHEYLIFEWPSEEAKKRAIETNELWEAHWYPDTPIGFHIAYAPTLEDLLAFINEEGRYK
jgi:hypothetical protein